MYEIRVAGGDTSHGKIFIDDVAIRWQLAAKS